MGPIAPTGDEDADRKGRLMTIKWYDQEPTPAAKDAPADAAQASREKDKEKKKTLVTNRSCDDLVNQRPEDLVPVETHKKPVQLKRAIKQHDIDVNKLTGLKNFSEISPNPLALPPYALPPNSQQSSTQSTSQRQGSQRESQ